MLVEMKAKADDAREERKANQEQMPAAPSETEK
jgi:hypothetical protein